jgi:hypothetical protein
MASKARLNKAIAGLQDELGKLEPETRQAIRGYLKVIQSEIRGLLEEVAGLSSGPNWIDFRRPPPGRRGR